MGVMYFSHAVSQRSRIVLVDDAILKMNMRSLHTWVMTFPMQFYNRLHTYYGWDVILLYRVTEAILGT